MTIHDYQVQKDVVKKRIPLGPLGPLGLCGLWGSLGHNMVVCVRRICKYTHI